MTTNPSDDPIRSLDEAVILLLQLDATQTDDLARVARTLSRLGVDTSHPVGVRVPLLEATHALEDVIQGRARDPGLVLQEVGRLIEEAMAAADGDPAAPAAAAGPARGNAPAPAPAEAWALPVDADTTLLEGFIEESREYLEAAESAMLLLESDPDDMEACNTVFRTFHTIKGTSAFLGLEQLCELAHWAESLLSRVREREIRFTGGYADLALRSVDVIKEFIASVQQGLAGKPLVTPAGYETLLSVLANPEAAGIGAEAGAGALLLDEADGAGAEAVPEEVAPVAYARPAVQEARGGGERAGRAGGADSRGERAADSWVRVRTDRLDRLVDMIGELVIAQAMIDQDPTLRQGGGTDLGRNVSHAGKIIRELQDLSVSMRMVPLKATFQKMARLVRDVAQKRGKLVEYVTLAEDTEIDRNMVELINDPLVHMIRNAVDHGIEAPDARQAAGKPRVGLVRLSAYHAGGNVVIELHDDGRGLDREKILRKAIAQGLVESERGLSDSEIFNLIFEPGFSTADQITDVSGRGVGMDVVKRNVEAVRGRIDIASEPGRGSTFSIRLPLTLAITDGMLVRVGAERYIVPTTSIQLSFRPTADMLSTVAGRGEMVLLRGDLIPIVRLHRLLDTPVAVTDPTEALLVVLAIGERRIALLVDELLGQHQVVAKSLGRGIGQAPGVSGGAILGDGRVGLILDPAQIAAIARQGRLGEGAGSRLSA